MKVICAGMSKTGTKSMHAALEMFGYSVHDYPDGFINFETEYENFYDRGWTVSDFRKMYENVDAVVDGPTYYFWEELAEAFPEAKVVLTIRDNEDVWLESLTRQQKALNGGSLCLMYVYSRLSSSYRRLIRYLGNSACMIYGGKKVTGFELNMMWDHDGIGLKQVYRRHIAHVINKCPKDRLLIFNCKSGWKPLCEFLGKPVPDAPFPRANVRGEQAELLQELDIFKQANKEVLFGISAITVLLGLGCYAAAKCNLLRVFWR